MASFNPDELNMIFSRGFEGTTGPLVPVTVSRHYDQWGLTYIKCDDVPQPIVDIGEVNDFVAGSITFTKDFWYSAVTVDAPHDPYDGAVGIRVTVNGDGSYGHVNIKYLDSNGNVLPQVNYDGYFSKQISDHRYSGHVWLALTYYTRDSEMLFSMVCTECRNSNTGQLVTALPAQLVNGTQWTPNQPWVYWYNQNTSGYYDPEEEVPQLGEGGGGGGWYRNSDTVGFSGLPSLDVLSFGFMGMYQLTALEMSQLSTYLWSDNFINDIKKNWQDPLQNIINVSFVPLNAELTGSSANIKIGNCDSGISANKLSKSLYEKDFGTINLKELYKNFADYAPYTKLRCFLPGAGVKELNPDDYMDGSIHIKAYIDIFSGTCIYQLLSQRHGRTHVVDHYEANIITQIPITGANFINAYSSIINGAAQMTSGIMSGNPAGVIGGAASIMTAKPSYEKSGSVTGSAMRLSVQTPYIFFDTPQLRQPSNFRQLNGYTSNLYARLGDCTDYVRVKYIDLKGINAPDVIKQRIYDSLIKGVHIH